jgi:hypothetical protein
MWTGKTFLGLEEEEYCLTLGRMHSGCIIDARFGATPFLTM